MSTTTTTRDRLHALVNALDDKDLATAAQVLTAPVDDDPVGLALALAPENDEPETDEERAAVAAGMASWVVMICPRRVALSQTALQRRSGSGHGQSLRNPNGTVASTQAGMGRLSR